MSQPETKCFCNPFTTHTWVAMTQGKQRAPPAALDCVGFANTVSFPAPREPNCKQKMLQGWLCWLWTECVTAERLQSPGAFCFCVSPQHHYRHHHHTQVNSKRACSLPHDSAWNQHCVNMKAETSLNCIFTHRYHKNHGKKKRTFNHSLTGHRGKLFSKEYIVSLHTEFCFCFQMGDVL